MPNDAVPSCRFHWTAVIDVNGKTVRSPFVPRTKFATGGAAAWICARILFEIAVIVCVVKRLAVAISLDFAGARASSSASRSDLRYAFATGSFV